MSYSIDGDPAPDFQWYFKGSPYNSAIQPTSSQLIIRNVTFENTGVYTLKVNNSAGEKNVSFRLLLNEPSDGKTGFSSHYMPDCSLVSSHRTVAIYTEGFFVYTWSTGLYAAIQRDLCCQRI